jgi:hypothetical protein
VTVSGDPADSVKLLARGWREAGMRAPVAAPTSSASPCCMPGCEAMSFVELKMMTGRRLVCFKHFQSIQMQAAPAR